MTWYAQNPPGYGPVAPPYSPPAGPPYAQPHLPYGPHSGPPYEVPTPPSPPRPNGWLIALAILVSLGLIAGLALAVRGAVRDVGRVSAGQELIDSLADQVAEIRQLQWKTKVNWRVVPPDEMREIIRKRQAEMGDQDRAEIYGVGELIKYLRLFPVDRDLEALLRDLFEEEVTGFYDPDKDELVVRGSPDDVGPMEKASLAHELGHALVDQHFDVGRIQHELDRADDSERSAAFEALAEGDASLVMITWASRHLSSNEIARLREEAADSGGEVLDSAPRIVRSWVEFPYEHGTEFVDAVKSGGGWRAVDDAYSMPPQSTKEILHPEVYLKGGRRQPTGGTDGSGEVEVPPSTPGCETVQEGVMGEFDTSVILAEFLDVRRAKEAADGWKADRFRFESCGGKKVFRVTILADSTGDASELADAWTEWIDGWSGREGNYPMPSSFVPGAGGGRVAGSGSSVSVILADDLAMVDRMAA